MTIIRAHDVETTGKTAADEVVEIAFCDVYDGRVDPSSIWSTLVRPARAIPPSSTAIHHITNLDVKDAAPWADSWSDLAKTREVNEPIYLAAHNASFERQWIDPVMPGYNWICTYKCSLRQWPDFASHSLQAVRYELALLVDSAKATPPHRAAPDAYVCAMVIAELLKHQSIETLVAWTAEPPLFTTFTFGLHDGKPLSAAPADYIDWLANKDHKMGDDWRWNARNELGRRAAAAEAAKAENRRKYLDHMLAALPGAATVVDLRNWYAGQADHFAKHGITVGTDEYDLLIKACEDRKIVLLEKGEPQFAKPLMD